MKTTAAKKFVTLDSFHNTTERFFELKEAVISKKTNDWGVTIVNEVNFKNKEVIITRINKCSYNKELSYVNYIDGTATRVVAIPSNFLLKKASGAAVKKLKKDYDEYLIKTLDAQLHYNGKIGCDPEIFAETGKGKLIPAFNFLGSKVKPTPVRDALNGADLTAYWDGFQAEFTTLANTCMGYHGDSIQAGLKGVYHALIKHDKTAKLSIKTVFDIPSKLLKNSEPEHVAFGCMKSLNAYGIEGLKAEGQDVPYRTAGGHIHFGNLECALTHKPRTEAENIRVVKALDAILGVAGVSLFASFDDPKRRQMYGLAGEYRLPPHGIEYRTLSNAWLFHPVIANIVFDLARGAFSMGDLNLMRFWKADEKDIIEVINTSDVKGARKMLKDNEEVFKQIIKRRMGNGPRLEYVYNAIMNGMESIVKDPSDIVKNWALDGVWAGHCGNKNACVSQVFNSKLNLSKV